MDTLDVTGCHSVEVNECDALHNNELWEFHHINRWSSSNALRVQEIDMILT